MAQYAGIAGTRQLTDRIGDEMLEMVKKWFKTVREEDGRAADLSIEGGFQLEGEAALDKESGLGVAVRAATPNLGPNIPVEITTDIGYDGKNHGTVQAQVSYYFRATATASNLELAAVRREQISNDPGLDPVDETNNSLGR